MIYELFDISEFNQETSFNLLIDEFRSHAIGTLLQHCILQISAKYELQGPNVLIICLWNASFF